MTLDLLDAPLRVTWDFPPPDLALNTESLCRIAERLTAAGVFAVTCDGRPLAHPGLPALLARLRSGGCRTTLVHGGTQLESAAFVPGLFCDRVLIDAAPFVDDRADLDLAGLENLLDEVRTRGFEPALRLVPSRRNLHLLPELLQRCRAWRVAQISLPNTPVGDNFPPLQRRQLLTSADLPGLRRELAAQPVSGVALEIHDLFLWELFAGWNDGAGRGEYGGCQAGNSLGHIDAQGRLHPCSSWFEPLGSLLDAELESLWASPQRLAVRGAVAEVPSGCRGCRDYASCFAGCRGLTRSVAACGDGRDLLCAGRRAAT